MVSARAYSFQDKRTLYSLDTKDLHQVANAAAGLAAAHGGMAALSLSVGATAMPPLIADWPRGAKQANTLTGQLGHLIDTVPACLELAGVELPSVFEEHSVGVLCGKSLAPIFAGQDGWVAPIAGLRFDHQGGRGL